MVKRNDVIDTTLDDDEDEDEERFLSFSGVDSQFSLSTPDFGKEIKVMHANENGSQNASSQANEVANQMGPPTSYSSLRNKIKSVQERYKKASMSNKLRSKFSGKSSNSSQNKILNKYRSHSHGALHSLCEFEDKMTAAEEGDHVVSQDLTTAKDESSIDAAREKRQQRLKAMMLRSAIAAHVQNKKVENTEENQIKVSLESIKQ